jgi:hypothetical protein
MMRNEELNEKNERMNEEMKEWRTEELKCHISFVIL